MPKREEALRLFDAWHAASRVLEYVAGLDEAAFRASPMCVDAVLRNLEIIGEAARYISHEVQQRYPTVDWVSARAMRNVIVHGYEGVSIAIVWRTVCDDVPPLEAALREDAIRYEEEGRWGAD
jgi:hypothetical protein